MKKCRITVILLIILCLLLPACKNKNDKRISNPELEEHTDIKDNGKSEHTGLPGTAQTEDADKTPSKAQTEDIDETPAAAQPESFVTQARLLAKEEIESILMITKTAIKDDIWYKGDWSQYKDYENEQFEVVLFINESFKDVFVLLNKQTELGYIAINLWSGINGYSNNLTNCIMDLSPEKVQGRIEGFGYAEAGKGVLKIDSVSQPEFPESTPEKEKYVFMLYII